MYFLSSTMILVENTFVKVITGEYSYVNKNRFLKYNLPLTKNINCYQQQSKTVLKIDSYKFSL